MTLSVVAIFVAKPGCEKQLEQLFGSLVEPTLREEGCIYYQLNRDLADPRRFVFTEVWRSEADLERHLAAPHLQAVAGPVAECIAASEVLKLSRVAGGGV